MSYLDVEQPLEAPHVTFYGRGDTQVIAVPSPGAGLDFTVPVSGAVEWCVQAVSFLLTPDATVAVRVPLLAFLDGTGVPFFEAAAPAGRAAGAASRFVFASNLQPFGSLGDSVIGAPIPELRLYDGLSIASSVTLLKAGDTLTDIRLFVTQYPIRPDSE